MRENEAADQRFRKVVQPRESSMDHEADLSSEHVATWPCSLSWQSPSQHPSAVLTLRAPHQGPAAD